MKKLTSLILALCLICALCACGGSPAAKEDAEEAKETAAFSIRSGIQMTGISAAVYYADQQGMFKDHGIDDEIIMFSNGPAINEALGAGEVDVLTMGAFPAVNGCLAYGERIVAWLEDDDMALRLYARKDSDIVAAGQGYLEDAPEVYGTPETWKGKDILITSGVSNHFAAIALLEMFGIDDTEVNLVSMDGPSATAAFMAGEADVICVWDPLWADLDASDDYVCVGSLSDTDQSLYCYITASKEMCEEHPDELVAYLEGLLTAQQALADDDELYQKTMHTFMSEYSEVSEDVAANSALLRPQCSIEEHLDRFTAGEGGVSRMEEVAYNVADFMVKSGAIEEEDIDILRENKYVDPSFLEQAVANLAQ